MSIVTKYILKTDSYFPLTTKHKKKVYWPVYAWSALIPESRVGKSDVLEELYLRLVDLSSNDRTIKYKDVLEKDLGVNLALIKIIEDNCKRNSYIDIDFSGNTKLTEKGKTLIEEFEDLSNKDSDELVKIYIFKDAISGDIIPNFDYTDIDTFREDIDTDNSIVLEYNTSFNKKPGIMEIERALKQRCRIDKYIEQKSMDTKCDVTENDIFKDSLFEEEVYFDDFEISETDLNKDKSKLNLGHRTGISLLENTPKLIYLTTFVYMDKENIQKSYIYSPFRNKEEAWFDKRLIIFRKSNEKLQESLKFLESECKSEVNLLKEEYNNLKIFKELPSVLGKERFRTIKDNIVRAIKEEESIEAGKIDLGNLCIAYNNVLEGLLSECVHEINKNSKSITLISKFNYYDCENKLTNMSKEIGINLPMGFKREVIVKRLRNTLKSRGCSCKDRGLIIFLDAYYIDDSISINMLKSYPDFFVDIINIVDKRNSYAHYNKQKTDYNSNDLDYKTLKIKFYDLLRLITNYYFGG